MSGPMSFPRRFPWLLAILLVLMFGLPLFIPLIALVWASGPPLQSYYLRSYVESSERGGQPGAKTEIRWVYKIAANRKPELATDAR